MIHNIENLRELKDHNFRVGLLSYKLANLYDMSNEYCKLIKIAGQYHDIGKILIPDEILLKPTALTKQEFIRMKNHTIYSYKILQKKGFNEYVCSITKYHHENFDGTGYPEGLKGYQIPIGSRIMKICDIFDALTNDRAYRKKLTYIEAIQEMQKESKNFESNIFEIFKDMLFKNELIIRRNKIW